MATLKSSIFSRPRRSVGNITFRSVKGVDGSYQTVASQKITKVDNPRTYSQQYQRAKFANAVKFFKRANQKYFKFAYEDKKPNESDFNAFMRYNTRNSLVINKGLVSEPDVPAFANRWQLSAGSLPSIGYVEFKSDTQVEFTFNAQFTNVAELSAYMVDNGFQEGDIVTLVVIASNYNSYVEDPSNIEGLIVPLWLIYQFRVDSNSDLAFSDIKHVGSTFATLGAGTGVSDTSVSSIEAEIDPYWGGQITALNTAFAGIVITREVSGTVVAASNSYLENGPTAKAVINQLGTSAILNAAVVSWGYDGKAILQGDVADAGSEGSSDAPVVDTVNNLNPPISVASREQLTALATTNGLVLQGSNLKAVALAATTSASSVQDLSTIFGTSLGSGILSDNNTKLSYSLAATLGSQFGTIAGTLSYRGRTIVNINFSLTESEG